MEQKMGKRSLAHWLDDEHAILRQKLGRIPTPEEHRAHMHALIDLTFHAKLSEQIEEQKYGDQAYVGKFVRELTKHRSQWEALEILARPFVQHSNGSFGLLPELEEAEKEVKKETAANLKVVRLPTEVEADPS